MPSIERFGLSMLEITLSALSLKYTREEDGDLKVLMRYDEETGKEEVATFFFSVIGKEREILRFLSFTHKVEKPNWGRALLMCNKWNVVFLWPKAYLLTSDDSTTGYVALEWQVDFEKGVHQEFLTFLVTQLVGAAIQFSEWSFKHHGFRRTP